MTTCYRELHVQNKNENATTTMLNRGVQYDLEKQVPWKMDYDYKK